MKRSPDFATLVWGLAFIGLAILVILRTEGYAITLPSSGIVLSLVMIAVGTVGLVLTKKN
ncbi:MAG: hypothetical protein QM286_13910 [Acidobacteriota bacterium]|jgi:hypothetical protein|nr:hypothetical protein [Acidobacteriota bacterium]NLH69163.1 hypothetical protein [Brooklawnia sp.]